MRVQPVGMTTYVYPVQKVAPVQKVVARDADATEDTERQASAGGAVATSKAAIDSALDRSSSAVQSKLPELQLGGDLADRARQGRQRPMRQVRS